MDHVKDTSTAPWHGEGKSLWWCEACGCYRDQSHFDRRPTTPLTLTLTLHRLTRPELAAVLRAATPEDRERLWPVWEAREAIHHPTLPKPLTLRGATPERVASICELPSEQE